MSSQPFMSREPFEPDEVRLAGRVRAWSDQIVIPIDAGEIAHAAAQASAGSGARQATFGDLRKIWWLRWALLLGVVMTLGMATTILIASRPSTLPPYPGAFTPAGTLADARYGHTATLLPDGRVLIVGGWHENPNALASAELWDPVTRSFSPAGTLAVRRDSPTSALVRGGAVLVAGGASGIKVQSSVAEAELWDPASRAFEPAGSLATARAGAASTALPDGRVLVIGGDGIDGAVATSAEVWDPGTQTFSSAGTIPGLGYGASVTFLADGRVLIVGGEGPAPDYQPSTSAVLWDPLTGSVIPAGSLAQPRANHTATLLPDGRVLVIGGYAGNGLDLSTAELWNSDSLTFSPAGSLPVPSGGSATALPDGRVLVLGGRTGTDEPNGDITYTTYADAYVWDPRARSFEHIGEMHEPRAAHTATLLADGSVLIVGGEVTDNGASIDSAELWQPQ